MRFNPYYSERNVAIRNFRLPEYKIYVQRWVNAKKMNGNWESKKAYEVRTGRFGRRD